MMEVTEEALQNYLEPAIAMLVGAADYYEAPGMEELWDTTVTVFMTTALFESAEIPKNVKLANYELNYVRPWVNLALQQGSMGDPIYDLALSLKLKMDKGVKITPNRFQAALEQQLKSVENSELMAIDSNESKIGDSSRTKSSFTLTKQYGTIRKNVMFSLLDDARKGFTFISDERYERLIIPAKKAGAIVLRGTAEVEKHLLSMDASAATIGDVLLFGKDVCVSEVLEEVYHYMQNVQGINDDKPEPMRTILNEISAKEYLIVNARKYGIPRIEIELARKQLEGYKRQLKQWKKGRDNCEESDF